MRHWKNSARSEGQSELPTISQRWNPQPKTSEQVTDFYLADLAARHGRKLATFDEGRSGRLHLHQSERMQLCQRLN